MRYRVGKLTEINEEKMDIVNLTLTFDLRSLISIGSEPVLKAAIQRKPRANLCIHSAGFFFTSRAGHTDTHTQTNCSENINPPRNTRRCIKLKAMFLQFNVYTIGLWYSLLNYVFTLSFVLIIITSCSREVRGKHIHPAVPLYISREKGFQKVIVAVLITVVFL